VWCLQLPDVLAHRRSFKRSRTARPQDAFPVAILDVWALPVQQAAGYTLETYSRDQLIFEISANLGEDGA